MKFPNGIYGANAIATPPTARSLKKSRRDKVPFLAEPCSDMPYNTWFFPINRAIQLGILLIETKLLALTL